MLRLPLMLRYGIHCMPYEYTADWMRVIPNTKSL
jgi:hypothetical protein